MSAESISICQKNIQSLRAKQSELMRQLDKAVAEKNRLEKLSPTDFKTAEEAFPNDRALALLERKITKLTEEIPGIEIDIRMADERLKSMQRKAAGLEHSLNQMRARLQKVIEGRDEALVGPFWRRLA